MNAGRGWAFVTHDFLGYDLREVAETLDSSVATMQRRLVSGRHELNT